MKWKSFQKTTLGRWAFEHRNAEPQIQSIVRNLKLDTRNIPAGEHTINDSFMRGGAVKFLGQIKGLRQGMWGYSLPVGGEGSIMLPLRPMRGVRFTSVQIKWRLTSTPDKIVKALVIGEDGTEHVLAEGQDQAGQTLTVPPEMLGEGRLILVLKLGNTSHNPQIAVTAMTLNVTAE